MLVACAAADLGVCLGGVYGSSDLSLGRLARGAADAFFVFVFARVCDRRVLDP